MGYIVAEHHHMVISQPKKKKLNQDSVCKDVIQKSHGWCLSGAGYMSVFIYHSLVQFGMCQFSLGVTCHKLPARFISS
jgi:hypothetical protein